ncbi:hypothetical protein J6590_034647 [Homalodisca vitripennis]|nr:hypothetical protein J6590_034647 [Homalodisca vitripennis]
MQETVPRRKDSWADEISVDFLPSAFYGVLQELRKRPKYSARPGPSIMTIHHEPAGESLNRNLDDVSYTPLATASFRNKCYVLQELRKRPKYSARPGPSIMTIHHEPAGESLNRNLDDVSYTPLATASFRNKCYGKG